MKVDQEYNILTETLTKEDVDEIKGLIRTTLTKLFYTLYVKKAFWKE